MIQPARENGEPSDVDTADRRATLREQASQVVKDVKELGSIAADELAGKVSAVKARGREAVLKGRARVARTENEIERLIGAHPFKSLLVAIGVGALIGMTLRRDRRSGASDVVR